MPKRLIILFDGTWNSPEDQTNVWRMKEMLADTGPEGIGQDCFYDAGVGTNWYDKFTGGIFGKGLSRNIQQGYAWLSNAYQDGDEVFMFGFSRGAYTARSLVGFIRKCGLLRSGDHQNVERAYELYRKKDETPDSIEAVAFRRTYSREIRVKFIGVWDTVGALGIPASHVPFNRTYYSFHDTGLSGIVDYAYHALAVDENRRDYAPTLWTAISPRNLAVEQRWFVGAHANVGGGYKDDALPHLPLQWLQGKAKACGLTFKNDVIIGQGDYLAPIRDSYKEFVFHLYALLKKRYYRVVGKSVNEIIDESVWKRWKDRIDYRPPSLAGKRDMI